MWKKTNPNPKGKEGSDCVIRAISIALGMNWYDVYDQLTYLGREDCDMPSVDSVWGHYLFSKGFQPFILPEACPRCISIQMFCLMYPIGTYIIGTGQHAVAIINGDYYDSWDSGDEIPTFFWKID